MRKYIASFQNEVQKLFSKKKYIVFLILEAVICAISILSNKLVSNLITQNSGMQFDLSFGNTAISMMGLFVNWMVPLIMMMAVCDLFSTEFWDETIKASLMRPVSRFKIYTAKISAVLFLGIMNFAVICFAASAMELLVHGSVSSIGYTLSAYLLDLIPLLVVILMAVLLNHLCKSTTMAMFLSILLFIGFNVLGIFWSNASGLLFTGYMQWHKIWLGTTLPFSALFPKIALLFGYGMVFFSGGYYLFLKR